MKVRIGYYSLFGLLVLCSGFSNCGKNKKDKAATKKVAMTKAESPAETRKVAMTKTEDKVVTLDSGLKYEIIQKADNNAKTPEAGKQVTVHYTGWLEENGKPGAKFDSSVDRGQKFTFVIGVGQVIKGWDEGVLAMKTGEKRRLTIPAHLAYGERGAGGIIPSNATLIFDVELFEVH